MTVATSSVQAALQVTLAAEHAASFGYSSIGVRLSNPPQVTEARTRQELHRQRRDQLRAELAAMGAVPVPPAATYAAAEPVVDEVTAQRWALELESGCASAYRYLIVSTAESTAESTTVPGTGAGGTAVAVGTVNRLRRLGLSELIDASGAATRWRALLTPASPSVPFPGS